MVNKSIDPAEMWQTMLGEMENGFNAFANHAMASPEFSRALNQAGDVAAGAQRQLGDVMEKYLAGMNLPSRAQMVSIVERLQAVEIQLDEIKTLLRQVHRSSAAAEQWFAKAPKSRRTRRPPSPGEEPK